MTDNRTTAPVSQRSRYYMPQVDALDTAFLGELVYYAETLHNLGEETVMTDKADKLAEINAYVIRLSRENMIQLF